MKPLPTDLQILNAIYERYYGEFAFQAARREKKIIVPIDIGVVAKRLGVDPDIVFGRLYYHLDPKFRHTSTRSDSDDPVSVRLFLPRPDFGYDAVHFPYMASVLAEMRAEDRKQKTSTSIAWFSLAVSVLAVVVSIFVK